MKPSTLNILFSEPDVFSVLPEWPTKPPLYFTHYVYNGQVAETGQRAAELYLEACEQSKANAIRIENADGIICTIEYTPEGVHRTRNGKVLKHGDIFQVEGFEYEVKTESCNGTLKANEILCSLSQIEFPDCCGLKRKVAILKLAKEEEPKEDKAKKLIDDLNALGYACNTGYNEAIDDVLKLYANSPKGLIVRPSDIEKLKK